MAGAPKLANESLHSRVTRARAEGRTQTALDYAKQLVKQDPSPDHQELLRNVTLERARQLLDQGKHNEAVQTAVNALRLGGGPDFVTVLATLLIQSGALNEAAAMRAALPPAHAAQIRLHGMDAAVGQGREGRSMIDAELQTGFDAIVSAFEHVEHGRDEQARDALQAIGLTSPFLDWKVFLRGLMAYYLGDDSRAIENWQRLDPERLPARMAAPFFAAIDPAYRQRQSAERLERLKRQMARVAPISKTVATLREIEQLTRKAEPDVDAVVALFEKLAGILSSESPALQSRIGQLYNVWLIHFGYPEVIARFALFYTAIPDDPTGARAMALAAEHSHRDRIAYRCWTYYERQVASMTDRFPGDANALARSLVHERMAERALAVKERGAFDYDDDDVENEGLPDIDPIPNLQEAITLTPDRLSAYRLLFDYLVETGKESDLKALVKEMSQRFPDHVESWASLGAFALKRKSFQEAARCFREVVRIQPLNEKNRELLGKALFMHGLSLAAVVGRRKKATPPGTYRPVLEEALTFSSTTQVAGYATWIVLELARGDEAFGNALWEQARLVPASRFGLAIGLHLASMGNVDLFLKPALQQFEPALNELLKSRPSPDELLCALSVIDELEGPNKSSTAAILKKLLPRGKSLDLHPFNSSQLYRLGSCVVVRTMREITKRIFQEGQRRFPKDPWFLILEADYHVADASRAKRGMSGLFGGLGLAITRCLDRAEALAVKLPREQQDSLVEEIAKRRDVLGPLNALSGAYRRYFDAEFGRGASDRDNQEDDG